LTFAGDIGVVAADNFAFAGETRRPDRGHITNLFTIITRNTFFLKRFYFCGWKNGNKFD
jgi:hypothetical protein